MFIHAALAVATQGVLLVALFGLAFVCMCHWAQRHGRPTSLEVQFFPPRLRLYSGTRAADNASAPSVRDGKASEVPSLAPSEVFSAPREGHRLRLLDGERS